LDQSEAKKIYGYASVLNILSTIGNKSGLKEKGVSVWHLLNAQNAASQ
jgi:hypothetical protein